MPHAQASGFPPRSLDLRENRTQTQAVSRADRGMARDRPSPYDETEAASSTVARGPVPRDRTTRANIVHRPRLFLLPIEAWRGTGPRPTACGTFFHRRAGACPPRSFDLREHRPPQGCFSCRSRHGEGQALALRHAARFFYRDVERFMKHPQR